MIKDNLAHKSIFSTLITFLLLGSVGLAVISHLIGIELEIQTYKDLKSYFFVPLKKWIFPVIATSMFSIFFRSPDGRATKFFVLLADIMVLYLLSTFIANVYAFSVFPLFPFAETIAPILGTVETANFNKIAPDGMPLVIWVMIIGVAASFIFRYLLHNTFCAIARHICNILVLILSPDFLNRISFIKKLKDDHKDALNPKKSLRHSLVLINFVDKVIFLVLMLILMLAPLAVYSSFLSILNVRGFQFFFDLGRFIAFYAFILFSYQFIVMPIVRKIFCFGIKGETYGSFFKKSLPVMATAATTASSMATLAVNIKAAQSLNVDEDMKDVGHNRALMPIGATFNMDGTSISLVVYFLLAANLAGIDVSFWWVVLTAVGLSVGTAAVPSASLIMLTSMYSAFSIPAALTGKLLSIIIAVDPIHDRIRTIVNTWGDLNMVYIVQCKRGVISLLRRATIRRKKKK
jgi:Na+/H+-dicarboxylate symporter